MGLNNQNMKDYITKTKFSGGTTSKLTFRSKLRTPEMKLFAACRYANYHLSNHPNKDHIAINKSDESVLSKVKPKKDDENDNDTKLLKNLINAFDAGDWNKVVSAYSNLEVGKTKPKKLAFAILISSYLASKTKRQTRKKIFGNLRLRTPKKTEPNGPAKSADSDSVKSQSTTGNHQQKNNAEQPKSQSKRKFSQAKEDKNLQRVRIKHSKSTQELINWLLDPNNNTLNDTKTNYQNALLKKLNDEKKKEKRIKMIKDAMKGRNDITIESIFGETISSLINEFNQKQQLTLDKNPQTREKNMTLEEVTNLISDIATNYTDSKNYKSDNREKDQIELFKQIKKLNTDQQQQAFMEIKNWTHNIFDFDDNQYIASLYGFDILDIVRPNTITQEIFTETLKFYKKNNWYFSSNENSQIPKYFKKFFNTEFSESNFNNQMQQENVNYEDIFLKTSSE